MAMRAPVLFAFLLLAPLVGMAQRPTRSGFGIMGGPLASTWRSEAAVYRPVPGFTAGLYAPIRVGRRAEIQPDLLLSLQGAAQERPDGDPSTMRSLYACLPISLKLFLSPSFNLQAGAQGGYLLWAATDGANVAGELNTLDMGFHVGMGIATSSRLDFTLRYYNGRTNALRADSKYFPTYRTLQFTVGKRIGQFSHRRLRRR